jgi:Uncharacterized conserved protein
MPAPDVPAPDLMDRISPTRRPPGRPAMRQSWRELFFFHWPVEPEALAPLLPPGLTLDTWQGTAYIGLVPFTMRGVRPVWAPPVRGLSDFHEVNVRTYVHFEGRDPGVWFFSLDAANAIAVRLARALWRLPYHFARMHLRREDDDGTVDYGSERLWPGPTPGVCRMRARPEGTPTPARPGTLEFFLAERYLLYAFRGGTLYRGQVYHTPYPLQAARLLSLENTLVPAAGIGVANPASPALAHYAAGVDVDVFPLERVRHIPLH